VVQSGRAPVVVALALLVFAMGAAFVIGTPASSVRGEPAARAFLSEWKRSRLATFVMHADFVRTLADGSQLKSTTTTVQDPPHTRLVIGFGSVSGRLNGKVVGCAGTPDGQAGCVTSVEAPDYTAEVDAEVQALESYVTGARPTYDVVDFGDTATAAGGSARCFRLDLAVAVPAPPYGNHALFCFDKATAAPVLIEIDRTEATDRTVATKVHTAVSPDDVQIPDDRGSVVGEPGPSVTATTAASGG
jgi:hypothetical protein